MALIRSLQKQLRLYSADPQALRDFYVQTFKLVDLNHYLDSKERRAGAMQLSRYGGDDPSVDIFIFPKAIMPPYTPPEGIPIFFVSKRDINQLWERLERRGAALTTVQQDRSGLCFFEFLDPDHNRLEICEDS